MPGIKRSAESSADRLAASIPTFTHSSGSITELRTRERIDSNGNVISTGEVTEGVSPGSIACSIPKAEREAQLQQWSENASAGETVAYLIGELYRRNIVINVCGRPTVNKNPAELVRLHAFAAAHFDPNISIQHSARMLSALRSIDIAPFRVDVGLATAHLKDILSNTSLSEEKMQKSLSEKISHDISQIEAKFERPHAMQEPRDVVLYGFGRIGRLLARIMIDKTGAGVKLLLRAIVVRKKSGEELLKRATLLAQDSVHGRFSGTITIDRSRNLIIANGNVIHLIHSNNPEDVDYTKYGINNAIIIDNTGVYRDAKSLSRHLQAKGASKVVLTAPAKGKDVTTIVSGVNDSRITESVNIYSAASCTTNAIVPILKVINEAYGIESGHVETVHSYTNDQNLLDNYHSKDRRGRSAPLNMVLTETGAASAVAKSIPELEGKLTGNAIRVPTANVSMALLVLDLKQNITRDAANQLLYEESTWGKLHRQIEYSHDADGVSSDFVGESHTTIVDSHATIAKGHRLNLYTWYDNEYGYSCQVVRLVQGIAGIVFPDYPMKHDDTAAAVAAAKAALQL